MRLRRKKKQTYQLYIWEVPVIWHSSAGFRIVKVISALVVVIWHEGSWSFAQKSLLTGLNKISLGFWKVNGNTSLWLLCPRIESPYSLTSLLLTVFIPRILGTKSLALTVVGLWEVSALPAKEDPISLSCLIRLFVARRRASSFIAPEPLWAI